jgi:stage V sporulation protein AF
MKKGTEIKYLEEIRKIFPIKESYDIKERNILVGGKEVYFYYVEGFIKDEIMQHIMQDIFSITPAEMKKLPTSKDFIKSKISYVEVEEVTDLQVMVKAVLSGQIALIVEGYDQIILMGLRTYPVRSIEEPDKERTLRGAKDGLVETVMFNTAMIRRRVRDPRLVFSMQTVGDVSKTDVCIGYIKGLVDEAVLDEIIQKIKSIKTDALTVGDQSLVEALDKPRWLNPLPKIRYTERPDVVAAHLTEGKFVILVDNSPTAIILPTGLFDFLQAADDFYFPVITGSYLRLVRNITMLVATFITPIYLLVERGILFFPETWAFLLPQESFPIPLFWQFMILEVAVDGLKLASLNTPSSLGMSLSVIGALLLGELSITAGWFIPQTILLMAVVALAAFSQPSIELSYANKFMRVILLIGAALLGIWGFVIALLLIIVLLVSTKTITKTSYLYPLIPFDGRKLMRLFFRTPK